MSEEQQQPPDVGAILAQLRAEVRAQRLARGLAEPGPLERDLRRSLDEIELHRVVSAHWPLVGRTPLDRAVNLVNKLVRRFLRWYINPIVEQQNAYNDAVARALALLAEAYAELGEQMAGEGDDARGGGGAGATGTTDHIALMALVRERGAAEPPARLADLELAALGPQLEMRRLVSAHWPLVGRTAPEKLAALVHRLTRQYLRWLINPIVEQQNACNAAVARAIDSLVRLDAERRAQLAARRARRRS